MTPQGSIERIAAAYPPEAAQTLAADRERYFTAEQRSAWELRFASHRIPKADPLQSGETSL